MPSDVRDRLRRRLWSELDRPTETRRIRVRLPVLATACAAAVLVAGSVVFAQNAAQAPEHMRASIGLDPTSRSVTAQADRCNKAFLGESRTISPRWISVGNPQAAAGITVTALRFFNEPVFCETTANTVTISRSGTSPGNAGKSSTGIVMATENGTVAGVVDPAWGTFQLRVTVAPDKVVTIEPAVSDGLFVANANTAIGPATTIEAIHDSTYAFSKVPMGIVNRDG